MNDKTNELDDYAERMQKINSQMQHIMREYGVLSWVLMGEVEYLDDFRVSSFSSGLSIRSQIRLGSALIDLGSELIQSSQNSMNFVPERHEEDEEDEEEDEEEDLLEDEGVD